MKILVADRGACIEEFTTWMKENGAEIDGIKITQFPGYEYGIKAERNVAQGDLLIAVPRKVMLTTENIEESLLGAFVMFHYNKCVSNWKYQKYKVCWICDLGK
jgi:histone-lysine N-methyltransferase SETD3